ncbi:NAD(P)-binding domain-containing protein [Streptomyces sp. NPDC019937]|uniref:NADPH-dependent F420 reductase n=1 Tax=Streptomyces sp. NPDC019937 TaxID=3154787 RepID=UPI0033E52D4B
MWLPDRLKASGFSPSIKYTYGIRTTAPNYIRTEKIENGGTTYGTEYTLYDGLLRPRQVQTEGAKDGRLIADTYYDGSGRVVKTNDTYYTTGAPTSALFEPKGTDIDGQTVTGTGMLGRAVARRATEPGLYVVLCNSHGPGTLADLVAELGDRARAATPAEAASAGDLGLAAVPLASHERLPRAELSGKTVIDPMNYALYPGFSIPELDSNELTSSELVQRHLADSRMVKALHNYGPSRCWRCSAPPEPTTAPHCRCTGIPVPATRITELAADAVRGPAGFRM